MIITLYRPGAGGSIRYYTIHDRQPLLTSRYALTVAWRSGEGREREKMYGFETIAEMDKKIRQVFGRKVKDGYTLLYSFIRERPSGVSPDAAIAEAKSGSAREAIIGA